MHEKERLIRIIETASFQYSEKPIFKLSSGATSTFYFDLKKTTFNPEGAYLVGKLVFQKIRKLGLRVRGIGGLTLGADPIAYAVSRYSFDEKEPIQAFVVRKEPKGHGTMLPIEGNIIAGDHVVIVDDVVTTGASTIKAIKSAEQYGLIIEAVIVLVDRGEQNGRQNIKALGYPFYRIFTAKDFSRSPK
ncbi:MAG: orotate phosphoribosyltransferase [Dissulfurispiraceae bacterium]